MDTNQGYKNRALANLDKAWAPAAIATLIFYVVTLAITYSIEFGIGSEYSLLATLITLPLSYGILVLFLDFARGEKIENSKLFDGYKYGFQRIFTTGLLQLIYTVLWYLLLIIPGIIKSYSYSMTYYILKDNPELKNNAAIEKSMQMMDGHKMDLFLLHLSFIGWAILCLLTMGIGFIFLIPYIYTAQAHFYEDLKKQSID
ncbi:MAG: DUF975 family protein [Prevotella sp.]|nr:DUF975 family protein [Prevotella sp.]MBR7172150.1 DUF975 family protein [Prevotella sp.]